MGHWALGIGHWVLGIGHWAFVIGNYPLPIPHLPHLPMPDARCPIPNNVKILLGNNPIS
ncbi:MAG: hypothetical protein KME52_11390 [Desmonostoc geniculatum HA4340-LM1]|nr:hypothetical protein [Desmonostoc geniculatum HA4340-LM1]